MDAYYINLDHRTDRREEMERELDALKLQAHRFPAFAHTYGPIGCLQSHLAVLQEARARGLPRVLIFEDDFECLVTPDEFWETLHRAEQYPCDVLMFNYNVQHSEPINDVVFRILEAQTASGYIVYASMYDTLIQCYEHHLPLLERTRHHWLHMNDQCWKPLQRTHKWLATTTRLGKQRKSYSDNCNQVVDLGC
jgi:GR25 family glycosyltransferase involved in LPS biosynthesis